MSIKISILGAGAGGQTMAAMLSGKDCEVRLYDIDNNKVKLLNELKKIQVTGAIEAQGFPSIVTNNFRDAVVDADIVMVVTTTDAHKTIAEKISDYTKDGQIIILNPGHIGGALEFRNVFNERGCKSEVIIGEAADLIYACRTSEVGKVYHSGLKKRTKLAALPSTRVADVINAVEPYIPTYEAAKNVLHTSFNTSGAMLHPIPTLLNMNRIDSNQPFDFYMEGITKNIAKIIEKADEERIHVVEKIGIPMKSLVESIKSVYALEGNDLFTVLQNNKAYIGVKSPRDYNHRFINEDVLCGLVPLSSFGSAFGVETPILNAFIRLVGIVNGRDYFNEGRTVEKLGLKGKSIENIYEAIS